MHDIWNPWHGCRKCSEGCENCYMYYLDEMRGNNSCSFTVSRTNNFYYPLLKNKNGSYKIKSGECIRVCMTSDFFVEDADGWRDEAWEIMRNRPDVKFFLLTKRPQRVFKCLPAYWGEGLNNVMFNVTCENQRRADERMPVLLELPFKHKGVMTAPLIGEISLQKYLKTQVIEQVICGGENYSGARPCKFEWVKRLSDECRENNVTFSFIETGTHYVKDGKHIIQPDKQKQSRAAYDEGLSFAGRKPEYRLTDMLGLPIPESELYKPYYGANCSRCGGRLTCNGCSNCGKCR